MSSNTDLYNSIKYLGSSLHLLIDDEIKEYAYDVLDGIAKAKSKKDLLEALYKGMRVLDKISKKDEISKKYPNKAKKAKISKRDVDVLIESLDKLIEEKGEELAVREVGLQIAIFSLANWWYGGDR